MPTSQKKIEANRRNAQKSTGPRTPEGKAISSRNAIIHGLYAKDSVITSPRLTESREEYDRICEILTAQFAPRTKFQQAVVKNIANCVWRYQRAVVAEAAVKGGKIKPSVRLLLDLIKNNRRLENEVFRAIRLLTKLQKGAISDPSDSGDFQGEHCEPSSEGALPVVVQ